MTTTPPGWYPDPQRVGQQRWWDGHQWTDVRAPAGQVGVSATPPWKRRDPLRTGVLGAVAVAVMVGGAVLVTSGGDGATSVASTTTSSSSSSSGSEPDAPEDRCVKVPQSVLNRLGDGAPLTDGWAVRSDDYAKVWFVAARNVNTWPVFSVNGDPTSAAAAFDGLVLSVNDDARDFTPWPFGPDTPARVSMDDEGAWDAAVCATSRAK